MKLQAFFILSILAVMTLFSSCEVIGGIFKAGVWSGVLIVVAVLALIIFVVAKMLKK